jgi:hypothetical protein
MNITTLARACAALSTSLCCLPALAGRPLVTDDAAVLAPGMCQVEAWAQRGPSQRWVAPACNVGANWEVGAAAGRHDGRQVAGILAKTVFQPLTADQWGTGFTVASSHTHGTDGAHDGAVNFLAGAPLASWLVVHANVGAVHHAATHRGARTWALAVEASEGPRGYSIETFGERSASAGWQAGLRWTLVADALDLDAGWGVVRSGGARRPYATLGMTWVFPR